jgi:hypothetical protein
MTCSAGSVEIINNYSEMLTDIESLNYILRELCFPDAHLPLTLTVDVPKLLLTVKNLYVHFGTEQIQLLVKV